MAIRFDTTRTECELCGEALTCLVCKYDGSAYVLPLTEGERAVLIDILEHVHTLFKEGKAEASAAEQLDLSTLRARIQQL